MADAFTSYFLSHNTGGGMASEEISNIHEIAFSVGDCETSNDGHHGTPQQRRCASRWGASIAGSQDVANIDLIELKNRFDTWYEGVDDLDDLCEPARSAASFTNSQTLHSLQVIILLFGSTTLLWV